MTYCHGMALSADTVVGEAIHQLIWRRRLRQRDVAQAAGMSDAMFSRKLRGGNRWTLDELLAVARYLEVPVTDLWCAARDSNPEPAGYWPGSVTSIFDAPSLRRASHGLAA